jgi:hypothetical protein
LCGFVQQCIIAALCGVLTVCCVVNLSDEYR